MQDNYAISHRPVLPHGPNRLDTTLNVGKGKCSHSLDWKPQTVEAQGRADRRVSPLSRHIAT